jgi:hypothetical protein
MAVRTFGNIALLKESVNTFWQIKETEPHVSIKLKNVFPKIAAYDTVFHFNHSPENCHDLLWFMDRYPLAISAKDITIMRDGREAHLKAAARIELIMIPTYVPREYRINAPYEARSYQKISAEFHSIQKRFLLGDDLGLGKTLSGILTFLNAGTLPAVVVAQTHLPEQWRVEGIGKFTNLRTHIVKGRQPYSLPPSDVYILKYSCLSGWVDVFAKRPFKSVVFDEVQELRRMVSDKYFAASVLSDSVDYCMGMSATPVYNYGDEIFAVLNLIKPGCLGERQDFLREWATPIGKDKHKIVNPQALGTYLREANLFLRRTRKDVGKELPEVNKIVTTVGYDNKEVMRSEQMAYKLAIKVVGGSFVERGQAARDLDAFVRHTTGVAKAKEVAAFVRILLENDEPVLLSGWHREVYEIWKRELAEFNPVMYTGSEMVSQKEKAKQAFINGDTNLFIISNRSGIGLDGLQHRCRNVVIGELDWSPKVHDQIIGRVDRDGQKDRVTAYFPVCDFGSDPFIIDLLGLKSAQAHGIVDPLLAVSEQYSDESRIKKMAEYFLHKRNATKQTLFS